MEVDPDAGGFFECFHLTPSQLPVLILPNHVILRNPSSLELADALGLTETLDTEKVYDVAVVGAVRRASPQRCMPPPRDSRPSSSRARRRAARQALRRRSRTILGFPTGISGQALAGRAQSQAQKFGARLAIARFVSGLDCSRRPYRLRLGDTQSVQACAVVIATGARYRKLDLPNYGKYEGRASITRRRRWRRSCASIKRSQS